MGDKKQILLGDTLETIFKRMGVDYVVHKVVKNCNCNKRKDALNKVNFRIIKPKNTHNL